MRLLLDENVSPSIAAELWTRDLDVATIRDRGMLGRPDHGVLQLAIDESRVVVTANADDFTALCSSEDVHPGLITMDSGSRAQQLATISAALDYIVSEAFITSETTYAHVFAEAADPLDRLPAAEQIARARSDRLGTGDGGGGPELDLRGDAAASEAKAVEQKFLLSHESR